MDEVRIDGQQQSVLNYTDMLQDIFTLGHTKLLFLKKTVVSKAIKLFTRPALQLAEDDDKPNPQLASLVRDTAKEERDADVVEADAMVGRRRENRRI